VDLSTFPTMPLERRQQVLETILKSGRDASAGPLTALDFGRYFFDDSTTQTEPDQQLFTGLSLVAGGRSQTSRQRSGPGIRIWRGSAWLWQTGQRSCGCCNDAEVGHCCATLGPRSLLGRRLGVWAKVVVSWAGWAGIAARSREARRGNCRAGQKGGFGVRR